MFKHIKFAELPVTDQDRAIRFYSERVGLKVFHDSPYQDRWRWIKLEVLGAATRILFASRPDEETRDVPSLILTTDDVARVFRTLQSQGVVFLKEPNEAPWAPGEIYALFLDSENNTIMIASS
jgi:lactoylglutathione lyase